MVPPGTLLMYDTPAFFFYLQSAPSAGATWKFLETMTVSAPTDAQQQLNTNTWSPTEFKKRYISKRELGQ